MGQSELAILMLIVLWFVMLFMNIDWGAIIGGTIEYLAMILPALLAWAGLIIIVAVELPGNVGTGGRVLEVFAGGMCLTGFYVAT